MKQRTTRAALAFLTATAAVVGFAGPASAETGPDPQLTSPTEQTFNATNITLNGSDITVSGSANIQGTVLTVNLEYSGDDLFTEAPDPSNNRHVITLRGSSSCDPGTFANLTTDLEKSITRIGSTAPPSASYSLLAIWNNSPWAPTAGVDPALDTLSVETQVLLTPEQAAAFGGYSFVLHGKESDTDETRPTDRGGLTVRETIPSNCATLTPDAAATTLTGNYYDLDFVGENDSGIAGPAYLGNNTNGEAGSVTLVAELSAEGGSTYNFRIAEPADQQCSGVRSEQPDIDDDNPLLGSVEATAGSLRTVEGALTNSTPFTTTSAKLNSEQYTILVTNNTNTQVLSCATLVPRVTEEPPFTGTRAQATTIEELIQASNYNPAKHAEILRLYKAFFNREPDIAGAKYWIQVSEGERPEINGPRATIKIAEAFPAASAEFQNLYGEGVSDEVFLTRVYQNVLQREPDPTGYAYWLDKLKGTNNSGLNPSLGKFDKRGGVVFYVALDVEFVNRADNRYGQS
jgi:hypothetical protein